MTRDAPAAPDTAVTPAVEALLAAWGEVQTVMTSLPRVVEERFGIPPHRFHVLGAVDRGASRVQDIADASWTSVSAASRTVDGLVRDGWVDRRADPEDRRATQVTLTPVGRRHLDEVRAWAEAMVAEMVGTLGPQRAERMAADMTAFAGRLAAHLGRGGA